MGKDREDNDLTLCLTGNAAWQSQRIVLHIARSATLHELHIRTQQAFGAGDRPCQLQHGFPRPQWLDISSTTTLIEAGIQNQDRIVVQPAAEDDTRISATTTISATTNSKNGQPSTNRHGSNCKGTNSHIVDSTSGSVRRSKRAAASVAEASFAESLRQQDEFVKRENTKSSSPAKKSNNSHNSTTTSSSTRSPRNASSAPRRFQATSTTGYRLQDGAAMAPPRRKRPKVPGTSTPDLQQGLSQEDASAMALLQAAEGGDVSQSSVSRLMRRNWKQAVNDAYEQNQAVARLAAIASRTATFETTTSGDTNDAVAETTISPATLVVTYPKGVQGRGTFTDSVDYLPLDVLQSVIAAIHPVNPEALRGENLALLSPRVLWSLLYHTQETGVERALQQIQPDLEWSFLRRRREQLSAKALENLRQQQEQHTTTTSGDSTNWEAAAQAIESVEQAMTNLQTLDRKQRALKLATAASQRISWKVVTPTERDDDELRECIGDTVPSKDVTLLIRSLLQLSIDNWRELANADEHVIASKVNLDVSTVRSWVDKAQEESLEEIMVEVCNGNVAGVELLREIHCGTPKDLTLWHPIVPMLHRTLCERQTDLTVVPTEEELQMWCERASRALEQLPWLGLYSTPL